MGGALEVSGGVVHVMNSSFEANFALGGGAIAANGIGTWLRIFSSTFAHNNASLEGGALAVGEASVTLSEGTRLHSNTAPIMRSVSIRAGWTGPPSHLSSPISSQIAPIPSQRVVAMGSEHAA